MERDEDKALKQPVDHVYFRTEVIDTPEDCGEGPVFVPKGSEG